MRRSLTGSILAVAALATLPALAGSCRDPWINNAYRDLGLGVPNGQDNRGECNVKLYGNGSWSGYEDLKGKVRTYKSLFYAGGSCRDSLIGKAYGDLYGRLPNGQAESGECDMYNYGNGQWSGLDDLKRKVQQYQASRGGAPAATPAAAGLRLDRSGNVLNAAGSVVAFSSQVMGLVGPDGASVVANDGAGIIAAGAGNLVAAGGGNLAPVYGLQSVGGKQVLGKLRLPDGRTVTVVRK